MLDGEIRYQPWTTSVPQVPSEASCSRVVLLRSEISTLTRSSVSLAVPLKVSGEPGVTVRVGAAVGGVIGAGALMATAGATPVETALAVGLSSVRLLPMVISLLPLIKQPQTRNRDLLLPAHLTAVSMWIEALRLLPPLPREHRIPFANGLGLSFMLAAQIGGGFGYYLATSLPPLLSAALLFLTPMSFLISTTRNCRLLSDWLALVFGLVLGPLLAFWQVGLDLLWTGIVGGSLAYGIYRLREARR